MRACACFSLTAVAVKCLVLCERVMCQCVMCEPYVRACDVRAYRHQHPPHVAPVSAAETLLASAVFELDASQQSGNRVRDLRNDMAFANKVCTRC